MDVHGKHHKLGGEERAGKRKPDRRENLCLYHSAEEDAMAELAVAIAPGDRTAALRINSCIHLFVSLIRDSQESQKNKKRWRARKFRGILFRRIVDYAAHGGKDGGKGLSEIGRSFGSTQHMRKRIIEGTGG